MADRDGRIASVDWWAYPFALGQPSLDISGAGTIDLFARDLPFEVGQRRKSRQRSAASMLTSYLERAGSNLSEERRRTLEQAKERLLHGK